MQPPFLFWPPNGCLALLSRSRQPEIPLPYSTRNIRSSPRHQKPMAGLSHVSFFENCLVSSLMRNAFHNPNSGIASFRRHTQEHRQNILTVSFRLYKTPDLQATEVVIDCLHILASSFPLYQKLLAKVHFTYAITIQSYYTTYYSFIFENL